MKAPKTKRARRRKILLALLVLALSPVVLFVLNGTVFSDGETPLVVTTDVPAVRVAASEPREVKALAWNIAKAFAYRGGVDFEDASVVRERIEGMAKVIREENPDFVFLSEAVRECTPCPVNQVELLAELQAATVLRPDEPRLVANLGACYESLGDWRKAMELYRRRATWRSGGWMRWLASPTAAFHS